MLTGRRKRPLVVLLPRPSSESAVRRRIAQLAREWEWNIMDLAAFGNVLPVGLRPDGAIVGVLPTDPLVAELCRMGCPVVRLGHNQHPRDDLLPVVLPDLEATGRLAARHFLEKGFTQVAYLRQGKEGPHWPTFAAFEKTVEKAGMRCFTHKVDSSLPGRNWQERTAKYDRLIRELSVWLVTLPKPIGILLYHDFIALRTYYACALAGVSVPEEVALLGIGNTNECDLSPVPLSSIDANPEERARQSMLLLRDLMRGSQQPAGPIMVAPAGVAARRSTDTLAIADPVVVHALRFVWDHFDQDLSVDMVAHDAGVGRRKLERAFSQHLGRGVAAELRRKRLATFCHLLCTTKEKIADLGPRVGFASRNQLYKAFQAAYGMTPREYRQTRCEL